MRSPSNWIARFVAVTGLVITVSVFGSANIPRSDITCAGDAVTSEHHTITATIGDGLVGTATSAHHSITAGFFAFVGQPCAVDQICRDGDVCTFDKCDDTICANRTVRLSDVNGSGACGGVIAPDLDDILCVLNGFGNFAACGNGDLAPTTGSNACTGNGVIDLDDILAVLAAFTGANPCGCPKQRRKGESRIAKICIKRSTIDHGGTGRWRSWL